MRIAFVNQNSEVNVTHEKKANTITCCVYLIL